MRVVYDQQVFAGQAYGGISRYFVDVARRLATYDGVAVTVLAPLHVTHALASLPDGTVVGRRAPVVRGTGRIRQRAAAVLARRWLSRRRPHVLHETYYARRSAADPATPTVVTVHDMIHELFPRAFAPDDDTAARKAAAVGRASRVICVSESTKRDLLRLLPVDPARVCVVHHGAPTPPASAGAPVVARPYLLYVGQRGGYKNFDGLLQAVASSAPLARGFQVVAFGGGPLQPAERARARALGLPDSALLHLDGDDGALAALYAHAAALVYPSLYEGFGLPPVEAMAHGCPVACSGTSSLPEVVGDAAELFDPGEPAAIAAAVERVVGAAGRADELRRRGRSRAAAFSWDRCARAHVDVYRDVCGSGALDDALPHARG